MKQCPTCGDYFNCAECPVCAPLKRILEASKQRRQSFAQRRKLKEQQHEPDHRLPYKDEH